MNIQIYYQDLPVSSYNKLSHQVAVCAKEYFFGELLLPLSYMKPILFQRIKNAVE